MRVAIVTLNDVVSPRLDQAPRLVIVEFETTRTERLETLDIAHWPAHGRSSRLARLGIDVVICGGLSSLDEAGFDASPVRLISGVSGPVYAVLDAIRQGSIAAGQSYWSRAVVEKPAQFGS